MAVHIVLSWVHRVITKPNTWALGVYRRLRRPHIHLYLDEFTFHCLCCRTRHAAFCTLVGLALKSATYKMLIVPEA